MPKPQPSLLSCKNLSLSFGTKKVLEDINFSINKGEIVTIIGPNGCGKTSFVKALLGLINISSGSIKRKKKLHIGYTPQRLHLDKSLPLSIYYFLSLKENTNDSEIIEIADQLDILPILHNQIHTISGGQLQRVLLARALLSNPDLLVLDEPIQGMDIHGQSEFYKILANIRKKQGTSILMISHDLHMVMSATDRVICMHGHICCEGSPKDIKKNPEFIKLFGDTSIPFAMYQHDHDHNHQHNEEH